MAANRGAGTALGGAEETRSGEQGRRLAAPATETDGGQPSPRHFSQWQAHLRRTRGCWEALVLLLQLRWLQLTPGTSCPAFCRGLRTSTTVPLLGPRAAGVPGHGIPLRCGSAPPPRPPPEPRWHAVPVVPLLPSGSMEQLGGGNLGGSGHVMVQGVDRALDLLHSRP